jgi:hypothetical protein
MWRDLFHSALNPETFFDAGYVRDLMGTVAGSGSRSGLAGWFEGRTEEFGGLLDSGASDDAGPVTRALLLQSIPMAAVLGSWLQGLIAPGVSESVGYLRLMAVLADDIGVGAPGSSRYDAFQQLLRRESLTECAVDAHEIVALRGIEEEMFALPAVLLAMSRRSDEFLFELIGVDSVLRNVGTLPAWRALRARRGSFTEWARLDLAAPSGRTETTDPSAVSAEVADWCRSRGDAAAGQVSAGTDWITRALSAWDSALFEKGEEARHPELAMHALLRARAREGAVYHQLFMLDGRNLSNLFAEARTDPAPLAEALSRSRLVKPGDSAGSPLVNGLISVRGPMFRIFSPEDLGVMRRWIDHLGADPVADRPTPAREGIPAAVLPPPVGDLGADPGDSLAPRTRAFAVDYVERWLEMSRRSLDRSSRSLPAEWTTDGLRPWLLDRHDQHDQQFTDTDGEDFPTREDVIDSAVQLAPLTLIDGSWLQGFTDTHLASSRVGFPLFETYWDELGNGELELNHPKIYRDVLRGMGIELSPTGSRAFAFDLRIREESLRLPVYWLCLGKLPVTFRPEILGMNLAMELSGVGGSYRSAHRFLKHYGFNTRFVDIHNTIDNVATGHSAWAADAIDTHMRDRAARTVPKPPEAEWQRVRVGYESLSPLPVKRGALAVLRSARRGARTGRPSLTAPLMHHSQIEAVS